MTNLQQLAKAINNLSEDDWQQVFDATRPRLLYVNHDDQDDASTRVLCRMDTSNMLFDIRDHIAKGKDCVFCFDEGCQKCLGT